MIVSFVTHMAKIYDFRQVDQAERSEKEIIVFIMPLPENNITYK